MEIEAEDSGTLAQLIASEGDDIAVGEAIAFIQGEGEEVPEGEEGAAEGEGEAGTEAAAEGGGEQPSEGGGEGEE